MQNNDQKTIVGEVVGRYGQWCAGGVVKRHRNLQEHAGVIRWDEADPQLTLIGRDTKES